MINIRRGIFETNSSSLHSIVIQKKAIKHKIYKRDLKLASSDLEFDSSYMVLDTFTDRVRYAIASLCNSGYHKEFDDEVFEMIDRIYNKYTNHHIKLIPLPDDDTYYEKYGSVDHQSYGLLRDFLLDKDISLEEFLTNDKYIVITGSDCGDNIETYEDMYGTGNIDDVYENL